MIIWKYPLEVTDGQTLSLPMGAKILCVQMQCEQPMLWALVDEALPKAEECISIYGTGNPLPEDVADQAYIGTFQCMGGAGVFHVFEETVQ